MHPLLASLLVMAATWDAWRWYALRVADAPEEAAALALTIVFLCAVGLARSSPAAPARPVPLIALATMLAMYAASYAALPPIMRAALAISMTLFCFYLAACKGPPPVAFWGLVALALPVLPSLQFTLGYPMRVISATLTVALLQAHGLMVARQGRFWSGAER